MTHQTTEYTDRLQLRDVAVKEVTEDMTVTGRAVPFNVESEIFPGLYERFTPECQIDHNHVKLFWSHSEPIGKVTEIETRDDGLHITARISDTDQGRHVHRLLLDDVVNRFSIGFIMLEQDETEDDQGNITITPRHIELKEVSIVPFPAYDDAEILDVRHQQKGEAAMPEKAAVTMADLETRDNKIDKLTQELALLREEQTPKDETSGLLQYRSMGEFIKALAAGDEHAQRTYAGAVSAETVLKDGWVGSMLEIVTARTLVLNLFQHKKNLPAEGMSVEYGVIDADSVDVDVQTSEASDLAFGKIELDVKSAPVKTLGGWTSLTRQAIERTSINVLDLHWRALADRYGAALETLARTTLTSLLSTAESVEGDLDTQDNVVSTLLAVVEAFDGKVEKFDGLLVSSDMFEALYAVTASKRILQFSRQERDKLGSITLRTLSGDIANVPVTVLPGADPETVIAYDERALTVQEAPGAPFRLQDDNIVNLTRDFSLYGYAAAYSEIPAGIKIVEPEDNGGGTG